MYVYIEREIDGNYTNNNNHHNDNNTSVRVRNAPEARRAPGALHALRGVIHMFLLSS